MKRNVCSGSLLVALLFCASPAYAATCAPQKLVQVVTVDVTPGTLTSSFAAQPKSLYRIGSDKLRIEEAPDPANGIHGIVVVAEPNIWMANLYDNTGKHIVDQGPTFFARAPVFGIQGLAPKLASLEFGCEANFLVENAPTPARSEQIGKSRFEVYRVEDAQDAVEILKQSGSSTPAFARYYHQGKLAMALRYDLYSTGLANDPELFVPPSGVRYAEVGDH